MGGELLEATQVFLTANYANYANAAQVMGSELLEATQAFLTANYVNYANAAQVIGDGFNLRSIRVIRIIRR